MQIGIYIFFSSLSLDYSCRYTEEARRREININWLANVLRQDATNAGGLKFASSINTGAEQIWVRNFSIHLGVRNFSCFHHHIRGWNLIASHNYSTTFSPENNLQVIQNKQQQLPALLYHQRCCKLLLSQYLGAFECLIKNKD